jgi:ADP-heptose:LPS heptosyltransferase
MRNETIRRIDNLLGSALCFSLTAHRRAAERRDRSTGAGSQPVRKVLFLKLIEQGATVLAGPALAHAVARYGRENIYFCVFPENRAILDVLDLVPSDNVFELRHDDLRVFAIDAAAALRRMRQEGIDAVIDMEFLTRAPAILSYLTGASHRVGLHRFQEEGPYRGDLLTHRVQYNPYLHTSEAYLHLVQALDEDPDDLPLLKTPTRETPLAPPRFEATDDDKARVWALLEHEHGGRPPGPLVLLNPNTGDLLPTRMWPADRFVALAQQILADHPDVTLVLTGGPSEQEATEALRREMGGSRVLCMAGRTSLRDVLVLYTLGAVLVTNDSGPGHFASMTDIENIVLFGPETPQRFGPLGAHAHVIWAGLACSPCVNPYNHRFSACTDNVCMQSITVAQVAAQVRDCLDRRVQARSSAR